MPLPASHLFVLAEGDPHLVEGSFAAGDSLAAAHSLQPRDNLTSSSIVNHAHNKPQHLSVMVECQLCEGRGHSIDIVERDGRRIVTRRPCPACGGKGEIDISHGPVTDDPEMRTFVPCENCGGEGGWPDEAGRGYWDPCPMCDGTGELASSERTLIDLEDLDRINRDTDFLCNPIGGRDR